MRLLIITNNPQRASFRQRMGVYLHILKDDGIEYTVAKLPKGLLARHRLFRTASQFDAVFLHKKGLNAIDAFTLRKNSRRIIFNFDDAVMYSHKHPERYSRARVIPFKRSVSLADMVIVGSDYLAGHAKKYNSNVHTLPIGLDVSIYDHNKTTDDGKIRLVWVGSESTIAYLETLKPALEKIGSKYNNVVLRIIGDIFFDLDNMAVEKIKWDKDNRGIDLAQCDIGLAPLPDDPFSRGKCSFKVLEYFSASLPVVGSPVGTNPDHIRNDITGFTVNDSKDWVEKISRLIDNPQLRKDMGTNGRHYAAKFDISLIGLELCRLLKSCCQKSCQK